MFNWLSLVTGFFYMVLGVVVIVYKFFIITLEPNIAYPLGALLILYGLFRIFRAVDKIKQARRKDEI
ncbi:C4-dicarboxylate ABC transporter [Chryseobacterium sp.]|nr:C4-dicarboxylate ABC transporter [Chryseobacterium sp.]